MSTPKGVTREVYFQNYKEDTNSRLPYIISETEIDYQIQDKTGSITFDGYYYVEDHAPPYPEDGHLEIYERNRHSDWLPKTVQLYVRLRETEPYINTTDANGITHTAHKTLEEDLYVIEIYKRITHESTDRVSTVSAKPYTGSDTEDEMNVCFFPTNKMTLYFRVLARL